MSAGGCTGGAARAEASRVCAGMRGAALRAARRALLCRASPRAAAAAPLPPRQFTGLATRSERLELALKSLRYSTGWLLRSCFRVAAAIADASAAPCTAPYAALSQPAELLRLHRYRPPPPHTPHREAREQ